MGNLLSNFFQTGSSLLSSSNNRGVSEQTKRVVRDVFDALRANPRITAHRLEGLLMQIPKNENFLLVNNDEGYNLLQICVGISNMDMVRWILTRNPDLNRFTQCSLPLHIACYKGLDDCVELLMKHGARIDIEARMCWPGPHLPNCEQRVSQDDLVDNPHHQVPVPHRGPQHGFWGQQRRGCDRLQSAICYAIDGDQVETLELLMQQSEDHWFPWHGKRPLLHIACERGAWTCTRYLVSERSEEINQCYDEYYPIHQAVLHDQRFLDLLIQCGAETTVRTATQQMTVLHILFLLGWKSAEETLSTLKLLLDHGSREQINTPDSLGNTPLHALIVRCALEESRYGYAYDSPIQPWNKWDMLHLVRFLLQNGAGPSINQAGNSALACVFQKVRDWEFRYELLDMLLQHKGDPNVVGRDGSVPLMVCLVPLINKDSPQHFTHTMKVFYLNCVKLLCKKGANPNCCTRSNLSPLHVLMFSVSENLTLRWNEEKNESFQFLQDLLIVLLEHGLDPNVRFSQRNPHVLFALVEMASRNARSPPDLHPVCELTRTLLQYGANPNVCCHLPQPGDFGMLFPASGASTSSGTGSGVRPKESFMKRLHQGGHYVLATYVQWLLKKGDPFLCGASEEDADHYLRLINLYYSSMNHADLHRCLKALHNIISLAPATKGTAFLASQLRELHSAPRSLKQNARVAIYNALQRKPGLCASRLPLPNSLKEYICTLDP